MSLTDMDLEEFQEHIENKSVIVLFGSKKCEPCKLADEFLLSFMDFNKNNNKNFKFEYIKMLNEQNPDLFIEKNILKYPHLYCYINGKEQFNILGGKNILNLFEKLFQDTIKEKEDLGDCFNNEDF